MKVIFVLLMVIPMAACVDHGKCLHSHTDMIMQPNISMSELET
jgi:hypothetical protein